MFISMRNKNVYKEMFIAYHQIPKYIQLKFQLLTSKITSAE